MGTFSIWHWLVVGVVVFMLFGRGKISELMGDVAKGIKAFKKGMNEDETPMKVVRDASDDNVTPLKKPRSKKAPSA